MPIENVFGYNMVTLDFQYKEKYWKILSDHVESKHGGKEVVSSDEVTSVLKECFNLLCDEFRKLIKQLPEASFFIFTHNFHENSIELWDLQLKGQKLPINESDFASTRRILKVILEHGCGLKLKGAPSFGDELFQKRFLYLRHLEELLYIGYQAIGISEEIARCQLFPCSTGVQVIEGNLELLSYEPYQSLFRFIETDYPTHSHKVELYNTIPDLKKELLDNLGLDYDKLASITNEQINNDDYRFGVLKLEEVIDLIVATENYETQNVIDFYSGLTVRADNYLSIEDAILKNQDMRRHIFRPILRVNIDGNDYCIIGRHKWSESLTVLATNALSFAIAPEEWTKNKGMRKFFEHLRLTHDEILEDPIKDILQKKGVIYDGNIKSIQQKGDNVRIDVKGVGEIDVLYLDDGESVVYVCECKHNRSRFDYNNWKRDYSNFKEKYETQLAQKVTWVRNNIKLVQEHFQIVANDPSIDISTYSIVGIFIINAPSIYMYNGAFRTYTIKDFDAKVNGTYENVEFVFHNEDNGKEFHITYPYFDNLSKVASSPRDIICKLQNLNTRELLELIEEIKKMHTT